MKLTYETHKESEQHKKTANASRARKRAANPAATRYQNVPTEFVCVDGEGITLPDGSHRYVLLGVGNKQISNPDGLSWSECFEFLWSQFRTGSVSYTGFFLGYDFVQILKTLSEERAAMLLTPAGRARRQPKSARRVMPFPVRCGHWEFDILGAKRLRIKRHSLECDLMHCTCKSDRWMHICDAGSFFQKSFLAVINPDDWSEPIVTPEEYETLTTGKSRRSSAVLDADMLHYNALENEILSRVLCSLNDGFRSLGIYLRPNQWFGPGQAAQTWLDGKYLTAAELRTIVPQDVLEAARMSYYGGWFELMMHGHVPGTTYEYDINSAYPYIISQLPCWEHGTWEHNSDDDKHSSYTLVHATVLGNDAHIGTMLHRDESGNISRPKYTSGWYWKSELDAAVRTGIISDITIHKSWSYNPCDCPPPLAQIAQLYEMRLRVGKKTPLGMAIKLLINSIYGKFAQSIGAPKFGNPLNASRITSGTREMILNAIATHPQGSKAVCMVATDGVYFTSPHPALSLSNRLGEWEEGKKENLCLFKPGVYWDDKTRLQISEGKKPVFKARGVNAADFAHSLQDIDTQFEQLMRTRPRNIEWPSVEFPISFAMVTAVQALARNNWELAGTLVDEPTAKQSSNPILKRENWGWFRDGYLRSQPPSNLERIASYPYEKRFGMEDPWSQEIKELGGISPDGLPSDLWKEALYDA